MVGHHVHLVLIRDREDAICVALPNGAHSLLVEDVVAQKHKAVQGGRDLHGHLYRDLRSQVQLDLGLALKGGLPL